MMRLKNYLSGFSVWIILLCIDYVAITVLFFTGHRSVAWFIGSFGTLALGLAMLVYIVFIDSRKYSPGIPWYRRLTFVFSYTPLPQHKRMMK